MTKRREFLKKGLLASGLLSLPAFSFGRATKIMVSGAESYPRQGKSVIDMIVDPIKQVKVGFIGVGSRGSFLLRLTDALYPEKAKITAVCDLRNDALEKSLDFLKKSHGQRPAGYSGNVDEWKKMVKRDDIDLVIIATPWEDHVPMAVYAMEQGKHVAVEVPAAYTLEDCWKLVNTAEATQCNCMMLENCCYGDEELWLLNMVQNEVFGTLTYAEAGYIHELRGMLHDSWRAKHNIERDGNLYPTHGLGPVAQYLDILRGDSFDTLVSMSSLEAGLSEYAETLPPNHKYYNIEDIRHGDMNNCLIKTARGRMILLQHDVVSPRPYSRINSLTGTKAFHVGYPSRLSIAGKGHNYLSEQEYNEYKSLYKHPIWERLKKEIKKNGGHGGMDFLMMYRLMDSFNHGRPLDMDVYDAAAWSVITPLSELSIKKGNAPVKFPDFTRGRWAEKRELGILKYV